MKIEKISDNQVRFILSDQDLLQRGMHMAELAYGSPKAQELFQEVMERAAQECDFPVENENPLIIEAIPIREGIMVIVTKINKPEDMDARFGFSPLLGNFRNAGPLQPPHPPEGGPSGLFPFPPNLPMPNIPGAPNLPPGVQSLQQHLNSHLNNLKAQAASKKAKTTCIFEFESLDQTAAASARILGAYIGINTLYKYDGKYYLSFEKTLTDSTQNILAEYGDKHSSMEISKTFLKEHAEIIIKKNAISVLAEYLA
ncbi:MAG: adaptor protein MecA [Defluviitaleaceae bacterium]|nr:adaptor protein MecA [Defluviitaleaceae bacterium]